MLNNSSHACLSLVRAGGRGGGGRGAVVDKIPQDPHRGNMGRNGDLITTLGPRTGEFENLISQSPTLPPLYPGWGIVVHNIDRCIS